MFGAHIWWTLSTVSAIVLSEILVVMRYNNWLFKTHPIFEGNNGNVITSIFHKVQW